jgi:hypothetical protein
MFDGSVIVVNTFLVLAAGKQKTHKIESISARPLIRDDSEIMPSPILRKKRTFKHHKFIVFKFKTKLSSY